MNVPEQNGLSAQVDALRKSIQELPEAESDEQRQAISALNELMGSLTQLSNTVEAIGNRVEE
jgi:hypothetical protein